MVELLSPIEFIIIIIALPYGDAKKIQHLIKANTQPFQILPNKYPAI